MVRIELDEAFGPSRGTLADAWDLTLPCVDDRTTVAPLDDRRSRWRLPCDGATLTVHTEWGCSRRIVIRCDDTRGVYVQRGG